MRDIALRALEAAKRIPAPPADEMLPGPYPDEGTALAQMAKVGRATVEAGLVDSFFGNISYRLGDTLLISRTGSSLDELEGAIDPCPMDGSSSAGLTASSELTTHMRVVAKTPTRAILHGHPRYAVITSLDCLEDCDGGEDCHVSCPRARTVVGVPIVPGEVGNGPNGLCNTVPKALSRPGTEGVIVYGHGLFTVSDKDLAQALDRLHRIETACREEYERRLMEAL